MKTSAALSLVGLLLLLAAFLLPREHQPPPPRTAACGTDNPACVSQSE